MRQFLIACMWFCVIAASGCKKNDSGPTSQTGQFPSGTITATGPSGEGFSFSKGTIVTPPFSPDNWPDFIMLYETGSGGPTAVGFAFVGTKNDGTSRPTFRLLYQIDKLDSAQSTFQILHQIPDTTFVSSTGENQTSAPTMRPYQIYGVKTYDGRFAKLLVLSNENGPSGVTVAFAWVYQPDGSRQL